MQAKISQTHRFEVLDSWRGIAATLVAVLHIFAISHFYGIPLIRHGWWFVDFFFVLSGFVISYAYATRLATPGELGGFVLQRIGRVYPLHLFMIAVFGATEFAKLLVGYAGIHFEAPPFSGPMAPFGLLTNLLMVHSFGFHTATAGSWNVPSWSIGVEFYTYLVFAGLIFAVKRPQPIFVALIALSIGVLSTSQYYLAEGFRLGIFRCFYGFFTGHFVWRIWRYATTQTAFRATIERRADLIEPGVFLAVFAALWLIDFEPLSLMLPVLLGVAVFVFSFEAGPLSRLLKAPPFLFLGKLSYSIYMTHFWIIWCFTIVLDKLAPRFFHVTLTTRNGTMPFLGTNPWMGDLITLAILACTIAFSTLTYRFVEQPGREYFRRLAKGGSLKEALSPAAGRALAPAADNTAR